LGRFLTQHGYRVSLAAEGKEMERTLATARIDLIVLDVMMPGDDGLILCRRLRANSNMPVIMLTAMSDDTDRIVGLEMGADDYLPKPFSPKELEARIATILRRVGRGNAVVESRELPTGQGVLRLGDLVVDTNRRQVTRGSERINLTYTEFSLLELLFRDPGHVVPRAEILEQLWGYPPRRAADLRVVDVYVARLRGKLEPDPRNPELILTVRGIGYASQRMGEASAAG
ncbi:MAG: response regulator, partial [Synechococcus sp.]